MSFIQNDQIRRKIKKIFFSHSNHSHKLPNPRVKPFFEDIGLASTLFFHDFYYYFPTVFKGGDLDYYDCISFIDYILTPKNTNKEIIEKFKTFDRNGIGHIATTDVLSLLRRQLPGWQYEKYAQIISTYGSTINYIDLFQKNRNLR